MNQKIRNFIDGDLIRSKLAKNKNPDPSRIRDIIKKSLALESLSPSQTAALINVNDPRLLEEMKEAALKIKKKVYDNRIVTFAPLYISNLCVNDCLYCAFRKSNREVKRRALSTKEVKKEVEKLAGEIGHKRLIVVYGEHPETDIEYMKKTIRAIYQVKTGPRSTGEIRRVNVNAPPLTVEELRELKEVGIGTYQVFQETYHRDTYRKVHPRQTQKSDYRWRLECMHRAFKAGIDDVGIGALFGLYDWKFEVMGLVCHSLELEYKFGIGPHTISFPRLEPAMNAPLTKNSKYQVSDSNFLKLITVLRLAVPYTGLIITAREPAGIRSRALYRGITQTDASTRIGLGGYNSSAGQKEDRQQFLLGDTRSLDQVTRELIDRGFITSYCTAGYRCGRTGKNIMKMLRCGQESEYCKLNAVLTFREWLDDFATEETRKKGEKLIQKEIEEIKKDMPDIYSRFKKYYEKTKNGARDLYF
ncbi:MAG: [FeFe] hydrogenase H-cluster radical SAM maturase HydG [Elusimicrobiota bacterium]